MNTEYDEGMVKSYTKGMQESDKNFSVLDKLGMEVIPGLVLCVADELL